MNNITNKITGLLTCVAIALPAWYLGKLFPVIGGAVFAILIGMVIALFWSKHGVAGPGIKFTSKYILQLAVVLLGFGLNLNVVLTTGWYSLPIIVGTISTSLLIAFLLHKAMCISNRIATLVGVGSSICGGSAIAATAPVINAKNDEIAQAMSVIFFYNVIAAIFFPMLGVTLGFDTLSGDTFGIFAGTAINDTSSVTAAAATWDSMFHLGSQTLDTAVTVKLTRTLAIIPITMVLGILYARKHAEEGGSRFRLSKTVPMFIIFFVIASIITTVAVNFGINETDFAPFKELSKFMIIMAMAAIGLGSNMIKLIKTGGKPIILGACCWIGITLVALLMMDY